MEIKRSVKAETVKYGEITSPVVRNGRVTSSSEVILVSEASGKIEKGDVVLREGTSFRKGQLLAEIYKDEVELALKARKSRFLTTITTMLPDIKVDYPDDYEAYLSFFNSIEMEKDLPELPESNNEKLKIFLASRNVLSEYYGILQDEKRLSRHSLYAPFNGTFTQVNFEVGGYVNMGGQIARMIRTDQLEIEVPVENTQSEWIKIGDRVMVADNPGGGGKPGIVVRKANFVEMNTQSRSLFVKVLNSAKDELLPGEYWEVTFPGQQIDAAMEIPRSAVFNTNEVFIVEEGRLKKRTINIVKVNENTLIFNGLDEGKKIVVEPLINVKENSPVAILGEEQPGQRGQGIGRGTGAGTGQGEGKDGEKRNPQSNQEAKS
jgi:multidrug efflux pump subunit AcrA (membrane-fusion protein)